MSTDAPVSAISRPPATTSAPPVGPGPALAPLLPLLGEVATEEEQRHAGYADGWKQGYGDGAARAAADHAARVGAQHAELAATVGRCRALVAALSEHLAAAEAERAALATGTVTETVDAALAIATAVVGHELRAAASPARDAAERALAALPGGGVELHLHPDDVATVGRFDVEVAVVADPTVEPGGCVARRGASTVDAQIATALARVAAALGAAR